MKLPVVSGKEALKVLCKEGFSIKRRKGSHVNLIRVDAEKTFHVTIPVHGNRDLNPSVFRSIARQAGYTAEEFGRLFAYASVEKT